MSWAAFSAAYSALACRLTQPRQRVIHLGAALCLGCRAETHVQRVLYFRRAWQLSQIGLGVCRLCVYVSSTDTNKQLARLGWAMSQERREEAVGLDPER